MALEFIGALDLHEHVAGEQAVPGLLGDDADGQAVIGIGAGIAILHEHVAVLQEPLHTREQRAELIAAEGPVVLAPPDVFLGGMLLDDELVAAARAVCLPVLTTTGPRCETRASPRNTISS